MFPYEYICKVFMDPIIITASLVFPQYSYEEDARCAIYLDNKC